MLNICIFPFLNVNIQVPAPDLQSDIISITGLANHLDRAREGLLDRVKELQAEQEDRVSLPDTAGPVDFQSLTLLLIPQVIFNQFIENDFLFFFLCRLSGALSCPSLWTPSITPRLLDARVLSLPRSAPSMMSTSNSLIKMMRTRYEVICSLHFKRTAQAKGRLRSH